MEHTGGLFEHMKNAKPHKRLSVKEIEININDEIKEMDKQESPKHYYYMGSREYNKFRLNPKQYFEDLINSAWR